MKEMLGSMVSSEGHISSTRLMFILSCVSCIVAMFYLLLSASFTADKGYFVAAMFGIAYTGQSVKGFTERNRNSSKPSGRDNRPPQNLGEGG